jgi:hypothetical protein
VRARGERSPTLDRPAGAADRDLTADSWIPRITHLISDTVSEELEVLRIVGERLDSARVAFMPTGAFALGSYAKPRMTRDLDFVVALMESHVSQLVQTVSPDFYIDEDGARAAIKTRRMFNLMHLSSGIKIDLIVRQDSVYRQVEFARRKPIELAGVSTWIVSREDLILSKLVWARAAGSELQMRDVRSRLDEPLDRAYLGTWAGELGIRPMLEQIRR